MINDPYTEDFEEFTLAVRLITRVENRLSDTPQEIYFGNFLLIALLEAIGQDPPRPLNRRKIWDRFMELSFEHIAMRDDSWEIATVILEELVATLDGLSEEVQNNTPGLKPMLEAFRSIVELISLGTAVN